MNRSQSSSWEGRCAGAGLRQNLGPDWGPKAWQSITSETPNPVFRKISEDMRQEVEKDRKRKRSEAAKQSRQQSKQRKTNDTSVQAKADYAQHNGPPIADAPSDIPQNYLQDLMLEYYQSKITVTQEKVDELEKSTRYQGAGDSISTNNWLAER